MRSSINRYRNFPVKERLLRSACLLFSEGGFRGTHIRHVCRHTGVSIAALCYHFHSKEELYVAVLQEAGRRLTVTADRAINRAGAPEATLRCIVESLFKTLSQEQAWIAKLLARELVAPTSGANGALAAGIGAYCVLLHAVIYELRGSKAETDRHFAQLHTLSVVGETVFYSLAAENLRRAFPQLLTSLPTAEKLARHVASISLEALRQESRGRDYELSQSA